MAMGGFFLDDNNNVHVEYYFNFIIATLELHVVLEQHYSRGFRVEGC